MGTVSYLCTRPFFVNKVTTADQNQIFLDKPASTYAGKGAMGSNA